MIDDSLNVKVGHWWISECNRHLRVVLTVFIWSSDRAFLPHAALLKGHVSHLGRLGRFL